MAGGPSLVENQPDEEAEDQIRYEFLLRLSEVEPDITIVDNVADVGNNYHGFAFGFCMRTSEHRAEHVDTILRNIRRILLPTAAIHVAVTCARNPESDMTIGTIAVRSTDARPIAIQQPGNLSAELGNLVFAELQNLDPSCSHVPSPDEAPWIRPPIEFVYKDGDDLEETVAQLANKLLSQVGVGHAVWLGAICEHSGYHALLVRTKNLSP
jgi:hypothetical protein